ncbi:antitoxin VapB family protein [Candidatus Woesearchaeota archaeon]|nr:antitoxin VapB family protein [Candidatus Woesearchaeota archaeon]
MVVKTITVTEDAYDAMHHLKHEGESFSELFLRLSSKPILVKDIVGILQHTPEEARAFAERVKKIHEELGKGWEERIADVRARLKRHN